MLNFYQNPSFVAARIPNMAQQSVIL